MLLKTAPPGLAVAVMAVIVVVRGEMHWSGQESGWSMQCRGPVCETAEKQAEGLARLRVLSDYIKETMNLMESVIASLDDEMVEVAQELKSAVGRRCYSRTLASLGPLIMNHQNHSSQQVSENIIEATSDSEGTQSSTDMAQSSSSAISEDVDTVLGSSYSTTQYTSQTPYSSSTTYGNGRGSQRTGSTSHASTTRTSHTSRLPDASNKYEAQPSSITTTTYTAPEDVSRWQGGSGRWQGGGHGHGGSRGQGIGRGQGGGLGKEHGGGRGRVWGHGRGNRNRAHEEPPPVQPQGSGCRGVPVGSPHYIPGLDYWCKTNCPQGNCPSTHCIC
ncbi:uncharacterized protein LOC123504665 isoform X2 [Portunus trituberculatus]|uniref:uncharacterized protein LOC123504665 isoform X2 n=1 Tax=Portunus trituberculatus TaxID=210409 RepID=UPI001E1CCCD7|nr:uncharacterized protein LOC123504665 isoform X2 [Portunus trituberculatus]